ncbi:MAG TPA: FAD-binding oxidoreductase [Phycisphaerales bacterium]|nr:FAD-binding oxidoreductase [Phycisphaerales bacterium]
MSVSYWRRERSPVRQPSCDVVIVGGGITGLTSAYELCQRGMRVAILERHTLGSGASSRNAGYLMRGMAESYALVCNHLGRDTAKLVWRFTEENLTLLIERYSIDSLDSFHRKPSILVAMSDSEAEELADSERLLCEDGFETHLVRSGSDSLWRSLQPTLALVNPHDAALNPWQLVQRLRDGLISRFGDLATIHENSEVVGFHPDPSGIVVRTERSEYPCNRVLVCTNAWAQELLPDLGARIKPNRGQMMALRAPGVRLDASYYLNRGSEYLRQAADGSIILGGKRTHREGEEQTASDATTPEIQSELERYAKMVLQCDFKVIARWAGTMGFSPDGLPIIARADAQPAEVWFCGGLTGHGMSLGAKTAQAAVQTMLGEIESPFPADRFREKEPPAGLEPAT